VFAGRLYKAVEQAEEKEDNSKPIVGLEYKQDGKFNIALR
jgi:hypothetical protein